MKRMASAATAASMSSANAAIGRSAMSSSTMTGMYGRRSSGSAPIPEATIIAAKDMQAGPHTDPYGFGSLADQKQVKKSCLIEAN